VKTHAFVVTWGLSSGLDLHSQQYPFGFAHHELVIDPLGIGKYWEMCHVHHHVISHPLDLDAVVAVDSCVVQAMHDALYPHFAHHELVIDPLKIGKYWEMCLEMCHVHHHVISHPLDLDAVVAVDSCVVQAKHDALYPHFAHHELVIDQLGIFPHLSHSNCY
jgi:hypothetical protein